MIDFSTLVGDGHVWHRSLDGAPLRVQANATFAHRLDWFEHCTLCDRLLATQTAQFGGSDASPSDEAPKSEPVAA